MDGSGGYAPVMDINDNQRKEQVAAVKAKSPVMYPSDYPGKRFGKIGTDTQFGPQSLTDAPYYKPGYFEPPDVTFYLEVCAVCVDNTVAATPSTILGCVTFEFNNKTRKVTPRAKGTAANDPTERWDKGINSFRTLTK